MKCRNTRGNPSTFARALSCFRRLSVAPAHQVGHDSRFDPERAGWGRQRQTGRAEEIQDGATLPNLPIDTEYPLRVEADGYLPEYVVVKPETWLGTGPFSYSTDVSLKPAPSASPRGK